MAPVCAEAPRSGGRPFCFVKLRTLPTDAPADADKYTIATATTTRWGRFLRASHLDELPQCWLVVTGRMSLVGPRPEMPALAATFDTAFLGNAWRCVPVSPARGR